MPDTSPKPFAFVVMPFDSDFDDIYLLGIKPAAEAAGYYCERLDEQIFDETMLARIYNQIGKADIVIGDMTGRNPNVFYEIGYAHALNKRTVLLTKESSDIPFDLTHHFHIVYEGKITNLNQKLTERLRHYIQNPGSEVIDPFQALQLSINGIDLDLSATGPLEVTADHYLDSNEDTLGHAVVLEVGGHLPPDSQVESVSCDVYLISSSEFPICLVKHDSHASSVYSSIRQSNGTIVHKPIGSLYLSRGSWDTVPFHLRQSKWNAAVPNKIEVQLRVLSDGLVRDIELNVLIPAEYKNR